MKKTIVIILVGLVLTACGVVLPGEPPTATAVLPQPTQTARVEVITATPLPTTDAPAAQPTQTARVEVITATPLPTTTAPAAPLTTSGTWEIQYYASATDEMRAWTFKDLEPSNWPVFPNVDNGTYPASQGLEYGEDLSVFCQYKKTCDFVTAARHYRLYTGDYNLKPVGECVAKDGSGCALMVINVGEVTSSFEDQHFDTGWTVTGRYWDGNYLPQAIWAGMSHATANMLNLSTALNPGGTNAGANCSVPGGCVSVESTFAVISGNEVLMIGRATVSR